MHSHAKMVNHEVITVLPFMQKKHRMLIKTFKKDLFVNSHLHLSKQNGAFYAAFYIVHLWTINLADEMYQKSVSGTLFHEEPAILKKII